MENFKLDLTKLTPVPEKDRVMGNWYFVLTEFFYIFTMLFSHENIKKSLICHIALVLFSTTGQPLCASKGVFIMEEIWKSIKGYEGSYEVSSFGRVKSLQRIVIAKDGRKMPVYEKILKYHIRKADGYKTVGLSILGKDNTFLVHFLVCQAFHGERPLLMDVNHKDGNKLNNNAYNLEWCTRRENIIHSHKNGLANIAHSENASSTKLTNEQFLFIRNLLLSGVSKESICKEYGIVRGYCNEIKNGRAKRYKTLIRLGLIKQHETGRKN